MHVDLVKGEPWWRMLIADPNKISYGTVKAATKHNSWMNWESVDRGQIPYAGSNGSLFFKDDSGSWFGLIPAGQAEEAVAEIESCLGICG